MRENTLVRGVALAVLSLALANPAAAEVEVGGQVRVRETIKSNHDFMSDVGNSDNFATLRTRVNISSQVGEFGSAFIEFQDTRVLGEPVSTVTSLEQVDLHQGYIHIQNAFNKPLEFKLGRTEMAYGQHRQIGTLGWSDTGRAFDGVLAMVDVESFGWVHFFGMKTKETGGIAVGVNDGDGIDRTDGGQNPETAFLGMYVHYDASEEAQIEAYVLDSYTDNGDVMAAGDTDPTDAIGSRITVGGRVRVRSEGGIDVYGEAAYQLGTAPEFLGTDSGGSEAVLDGMDIAAYALVLGGNYSFAAGEGKAWLGAEFNMASGDDGADATEDKTYHQLFPTGHAVLGYIDFVGWQNIQALQITAGIQPNDSWRLWASFHNFSLVEAADAWYAANGQAVGGLVGDTAFSSGLGSEIDVSVRFQPEPSLRFEGHLANWMPGDWQKQATALAGGAASAAEAVSSPADLSSALSVFLLSTLTF